jgi:hypothetical protein
MALASSIETNDGTVTTTGIVIALAPTYDPNAVQELWRAADSAGAPDSANAVRVGSLSVPPGGLNYVDHLPTDGTIWWYRTRMTGGPYGDSTYSDWVKLGTADRLSRDGSVGLGAVGANASTPANAQQNARIGPQGNLLPNPGFEDGLAFWLALTGTTTAVNTPANANGGNWYGQLTSTTGVAAQLAAADDASRARYFEVNTNDVVQFGGFLYRESGTANVRYVLELTDKDKANPTLFTSPNQNTAAWLQVQAQTIVAAGKKYARVWAEVDATGVATVARVDDAYMRIALGAIYDVPPPNSLYEIRFANAVPDPDTVDGLQSYIDFVATTNAMRFATSPQAILGSTAVNPSVVNVAAHGFTTGDVVTIRGHLTNTAINGTWVVTVIDADHFSVPVLGNGTGVGTGHVVKLRLTVKPNGDLSLYGGVLTAGQVKDRNSKFTLDLDGALATVVDSQGSPVTRVKLGKVGAGTADYGIQVFDQNAATVIDFTGAKRILAVPVQPSVDSGTALTVDLSTGLTQQIRLTGTATLTLNNAVNGSRYRTYFQQDATGSRPFPTIVDGASGNKQVMFTGGAAPTLTATPGQIDCFELEYRTTPSARYALFTLGLNVTPVTPVALDRLTQAFTTAATTHNVTMPTTVVAGQLLLIVFQSDISQGANAPTTPTGWTQIKTMSTNASAGQLTVLGKIAAGTEGGTSVNVATSALCTAVALTYRIDTWFGSLTSTGIAVSTGATGSSTTPNPDAVTPSWTVDRDLYLAVCGMSNTSATSAAPTNYTNLDTNNTGTTPGAGAAVAERPLYATSDDPGTFTIGTSANWAALTLAVRPPA